MTNYRENMFDNKQIARCSACGEPLYDGDTAYLIGERHYCTSCVDDGLIVCRAEYDCSCEVYSEFEGYDE